MMSGRDASILCAVLCVVCTFVTGVSTFGLYWHFGGVEQQARAAYEDGLDAKQTAREAGAVVRDIDRSLDVRFEKLQDRLVLLELCVDMDVKVSYVILKDGSEVGRDVKPLKEFLALSKKFEELGEGLQVIATGKQ